MKTIVVVPTLNEAANVSELINRVRSLDLKPDILIVDDSSPDGTADIVEEISLRDAGVKLLRRTGPGSFSGSYIDGFRYALDNGYDAVVCMDADLSHNPDEIPTLLAGLKDYGLVSGSRYIPGKIRITGWPLSRLVLSRASSAYIRLITRLPVHDPMGGFKAIRRDALEALDFDRIVSQGYAFQAEVLYRLFMMGIPLGEVPISFIDRKFGESKMSLRRIREAIILPLRLKFKLGKEIRRRKQA